MRRLLLLPILLLASAALAQDGIVSSAETDQAEYAYGETILFRYTISNESDEPLTLEAGSGSCQVLIEFGPLPSITRCTADVVRIDFAPHSSRTWVWEIVPSEHGVPAASGEQTITAVFDFNRFPATASLTAPQYLGGRLYVDLAAGVTLGDVQNVVEALNVEVLEYNAFYNSYLWEISGMTLEDAIATYASDPRFEYIEAERTIMFSQSFATGADDGAAPLAAPVLTAASPNPFTTSTSFSLSVPASGPARVEVFDLLGRRVATLHDGPLAGGVEHHFTFRARTLPAGLYVVRASGEGFSETRRITLAR